jgi:kynurenine formamidase
MELNMRNVFLLIISLSLISFNASALEKPEPMNEQEFDQLFEEISNWGRWGSEDELGTLNTITDKKRKQAARLVKEGKTVSLELELNKTPNMINALPFEHEVFLFGAEETLELGLDLADLPEIAGDVFSINYHGFSHSHMDGLPHFAYKGKMYNGFPFEPNVPKGFTRLGVENIAEVGIFTRGVIVDLPKFLGIDFIHPGNSITIEVLEAWEKASQTKVSPGDVLLIRTGRWEKVSQDGHWNFQENAAGLHATVAKWLKERDVAAIGCDGVSDVMPSGTTRLNPLHELAIISLGMPIFDNLDLEKLAEVSNETKRNTFLFVAAPLNVEGATGSPLNPMAIF